MNLLPITCVNHIMRYLADMENKKYIAVFEECGKLNWKINANLYKNLTNIINHKKENPPTQTDYRIINTTYGPEGPARQFTSVILPERNNQYINYMCSLDNSIYIEKLIFTDENGLERWTGNYHRPYHPEKGERYKFILWMTNDEIMVHTENQIHEQVQIQQEPQAEPWNDDLTDEEIQDDETDNDETFNLSEEDMDAIHTDFVFHFPPV